MFQSHPVVLCFRTTSNNICWAWVTQIKLKWLNIQHYPQTYTWGGGSCLHSQCWNTHRGRLTVVFLRYKVTTQVCVKWRATDNLILRFIVFSLVQNLSSDFLDVMTWWYLLRQGQGAQGGRVGREDQAVREYHYCRGYQEGPAGTVA